MVEATILPSRALDMPRSFRAAGPVTEAQFCKSHPLPNLRSRGNTAAQKAGKRYEKKAFTYLKDRYGLDVLLHPWIAFTNGKHERLCQPDALVIRQPKVFIIEVKVRHTVDAYWQLARLYAPVVATLFKNYSVHLIEMTKSFDPDVLFPTPIIFSYEMDDFLKSPPCEMIGVNQWSG
jgi:hypothetical protein